MLGMVIGVAAGAPVKIDASIEYSINFDSPLAPVTKMEVQRAEYVSALYF